MEQTAKDLAVSKNVKHQRGTFPLLESMSFTLGQWNALTQRFERLFRNEAGLPDAVENYAKLTGSGARKNVSRFRRYFGNSSEID